MIKAVTLPEFMPDQSNISGILTEAKNVYPAADGYRPVGSIVVSSSALAARFLGGGSAISSSGTAFLLAGTATNLYKVTTAGAWTSILSGLTVTSRWKFATFRDLAGADYAIAVNGTSDSYAVDLSAGTAAVIAAMPGAIDVAVIGDHVVIARPDADIAKVAWSAFGDHTAWTVGTDQAGDQPMRTGGPVQAIVGGEYGLILQRNRIVRMTRTGDAITPFQFDEISSNYGCADGATVAQAGRTVFFLSDRGFVALDDGQALRTIGSEKVDRTFASLVPRDSLSGIYTAVDPANNLVFWLVPGTPSTLWVYNFEMQRWTTIELTANGLFPGFTNSISLDDLPGLGYTDLDAMTITLDDSRWIGGSPRLYVISGSNELGTLTGTKLAASFQLGNVTLAPGRNARMRSVRPAWDGTSGITVRVNAKARLGDSDNVFSCSDLRTSGILPVRAKGRYHAVRVEVAAETTWSYIHGLDYEYEIGGIR